MNAGERLPSLAEGVSVADFGTELVVLVGPQRRAHHLDAGLSLVVDSCAAGTNRPALVDEVARATGDRPEQVCVWLDACLAELGSLGIVTADAA